MNADLTAGPAGITFNATGGSSQASGTSLISPAGLLALQGGNHNLTSATNNVSAVASIAGDIDFVNSGALQVGIPGTVGMQNTGTINVSTVNGNIDIVIILALQIRAVAQLHLMQALAVQQAHLAAEISYSQTHL